MSIKQLLIEHENKTLILNDPYLLGSSWIYHKGVLTRKHRVLLETEEIVSNSCIEQENSFLFTLENKTKVEMSYENEKIILQFPGFSTTKHRYKNYTWC